VVRVYKLQLAVCIHTFCLILWVDLNPKYEIVCVEVIDFCYRTGLRGTEVGAIKMTSLCGEGSECLRSTKRGFPEVDKNSGSLVFPLFTRWFKYDRDKL
jgi:hypothetical protein